MEQFINNIPPEEVRAEYFEVEPNVCLHITDGGQGRPIVFIHGWPLSDEIFEYQYNNLINAGFRVVGITLRGFGKSDKPFGSYDYDVHTLDIDKVLIQLEINNAVLVGFSMGAAIAIRYVSAYYGAHISKLVLVGAAAPIWTQRPDFPYNLQVSAVDELIELSKSDRPKLISDFAKIFSATEKSLNDGINHWLYEMCLNASPYATTQSLYALRNTDLRDDLKNISIPTMIMHGKKDKICSFSLAKLLKAAIVDSEIVAFENSGHSLILEETTKFNAELIKFSTI